jgi:hypothetical protein
MRWKRREKWMDGTERKESKEERKTKTAKELQTFRKPLHGSKISCFRYVWLR